MEKVFILVFQGHSGEAKVARGLGSLSQSEEGNERMLQPSSLSPLIQSTILTQGIA